MTQYTLGQAYRAFATPTTPIPLDTIADFEWATVTQALPLRVRLDGEESAQAATPPSLEHAGYLTVGSRVMTMLVKGSLIVIGKYGGGAAPYTYTPVADIISGSVAASTWYRKKDDGELICRGFNTFPDDAGVVNTFTWTFPVAFVGETPQIVITPNTSAPQVVHDAFTALGLTSVIIQFLRETSNTTNVYFEARGRWK